MNDVAPSTKPNGAPAKGAQGETKAQGFKAMYAVKIAVVAVVVVAAFVMLYRQFKEVKIEEVLNGFHEIRAWKIGLAILLTGAYYLILAGYDLIALQYLNKRIGLFKVMIGAIVGYAVSHQFGWILGGTAARYYLYSNWGLRGWEIVKFIADNEEPVMAGQPLAEVG